MSSGKSQAGPNPRVFTTLALAALALALGSAPAFAQQEGSEDASGISGISGSSGSSPAAPNPEPAPETETQPADSGANASDGISGISGSSGTTTRRSAEASSDEGGSATAEARPARRGRRSGTGASRPARRGRGSETAAAEGPGTAEARAAGTVAARDPQFGIPCTDDNNPATTIKSCIYWIPDYVPFDIQQEERYSHGWSVEVQYYHEPETIEASYNQPYFIRVVEHRRGGDRLIGTMRRDEYNATGADVQQLFNNFFAAALTGRGNSGIYGTIPHLPAFLITGLGITAMYWIIQKMTGRALPSSAYVISRIFNFIRTRGWRQRPTVTTGTLLFTGAFALALYFEVTYVEGWIYERLRRLADDNNWFDHSRLYINFLNSHLTNGSMEDCLRDAAQCEHLAVSAHFAGMVSSEASGTAEASESLNELDETLRNGEGPQLMTNPPVGAVAGSTAAASAEPVIRPGIRTHDLSFVAEAFRSFFRPPCNSEPEVFTNLIATGAMGPETRPIRNAECLGNIGVRAGFRHPRVRHVELPTDRIPGL